MTLPPKHIPPEVHAKWLALRQKHEEDSTDFQCQVKKNRAEFESRVEKARKALLERHINEERDFWSKAGQVPKNTASATKTNPKQPRVTAKSTAKSSRQTTTAAKTPASRPATPNDRARPSNAPAKASQGPKSSQVLPTAPKRRKQQPKKNGVLEVIDLISDDEESPTPAKKTRATSVSVATGNAHKQPIVHESDSQEFASHNRAPKKPSFAIPGATLELFGSPSTKHMHGVQYAPLHIKGEIDLMSSARPIEPTPPQPMPPQIQFHGVPGSVPSTLFTFPPQASTSTPQAGVSGIMSRLTPPSTPGFGASRSDHLSSVFPARAATAMPHSDQALAAPPHFTFPSYQQPGRFGPGSTANPAPPLSPFPFQTKSASGLSSPLARAAVPDIHGRCQTAEQPHDASQNATRREPAQEIRTGEPSSRVRQHECPMPDAPAPTTASSFPSSGDRMAGDRALDRTRSRVEDAGASEIDIGTSSSFLFVRVFFSASSRLMHVKRMGWGGIGSHARSVGYHVSWDARWTVRR
ncbi:hypothetical protein BDU57DRAFT_527483 [Ampelomyces quisqualis]|uniref:Uncharacterized protein n=1 Tax=Ampelomyces quisqualis TaxID=50730 RepID=A0A6A5QY29_AMPQU|nr:hypothetical protein BDU57DRAFT_527483 [Ampelomyces quisqualis]